MIFVLVGARGVGKTDFLEKLKVNFPDLIGLDLDKVISEETGLTTEDFFNKFGETAFRDQEMESFEKIFSQLSESNSPACIAVGAGFSGEIPSSAQVIWLQRPTDPQGRIFFDRPRLDGDKSEKQEYLDRFNERKPIYARQSNFELELIEGGNSLAVEMFSGFLRGEPKRELGNFDITLNQKTLKNLWLIRKWIQQGVRYFELRDDILQDHEAREAIKYLPQDKILISCRDRTGWGYSLAREYDFFVDWPVEWETTPSLDHCLSFHGSGQSMDQAINQLQQKSNTHTKFVKLAPNVDDYAELKLGHDWFLQDPQQRAFLPISSGGRWQWYRILFGPKMPVHFVRMGYQFGVLDQPTYVKHILFNSFLNNEFAGVIGDPVDHSWTPSFHFDFFQKKKIPVLSIPLSETEFDSGALGVLVKLGLQFVAVTSPLKNKVFHWVGQQKQAQLSPSALELESVNTLDLRAESIKATNTDVVGLQSVLEEFQDSKVAMWGGGGTHSSALKCLPQLSIYAARTGRLSLGGQHEPEVLLWAVSAQHEEGIQFPPESWRPDTVVDFNYAENSPGRGYAKKQNARYISGAGFFKNQALAQQKFWSPL